MSPHLPQRRRSKGIRESTLIISLLSLLLDQLLTLLTLNPLFSIIPWLLSSAPSMKTIMARTSHESSFSFSKRHFQWIIGKGGASADSERKNGEEEVEVLTFAASSSQVCDEEAAATAKKRSSAAATVTLSRFRSVLAAVIAGRGRGAGLGARVTGTLFGHRRGHVQFAFQADPRACPAALIELAAPTSALVREMASGLVRIALECERGPAGGGGDGKGAGRLLEERLWRAYCNGKKCGYAVRRECGPSDWKVLRAVEPVSMGAGVLPAEGGEGPDGEMMYMRARFERVVGSKDSEAFYMLNPDSNGGPELSIYFLRV